MWFSCLTIIACLTHGGCFYWFCFLNHWSHYLAPLQQDLGALYFSLLTCFLTLEEFPLSLYFCLFIFSVVTDVFSLWGIVFPLHPLSNFITTGDFSSPSIIVPHLPWADAKNEIMLKFPKILSQLSCPNPRCSSLLWAHEGLAQIERIYLCPAMVILRLYRHPRTQGKEFQVNRDFFCEFDSFELWDIMPIKQRHWKFFFGFILFIYFF